MTEILRIDKFHVPEASLAEFLAKVRETHDVLGRLDGIVANDVVRLQAGESHFNVVTVVKWRDRPAHDSAGRVMAERARSSGFDRAAFWERLGVEADLGTYAT
ncbi:antibiotic biosynthesis monooxygenase [Prescottella agglutinans]|uniref:Heme-degrading monooxygenase HmoA n=1 Tax=Prescottella agglutinans TaxID=1644129 RepID=A0ABT6MBH1_9NOCA|nr:antibiotic biosynthesis monooxygenase [Prescottella agglutinans]MDH6281279.1 heme-degrading monooxygenase HmoA [Prescottella agglutinans]